MVDSDGLGGKRAKAKKRKKITQSGPPDLEARGCALSLAPVSFLYASPHLLSLLYQRIARTGDLHAKLDSYFQVSQTPAMA
jgi:hypothetical protein